MNDKRRPFCAKLEHDKESESKSNTKPVMFQPAYSLQKPVELQHGTNITLPIPLPQPHLVAGHQYDFNHSYKYSPAVKPPSVPPFPENVSTSSSTTQLPSLLDILHPSRGALPETDLTGQQSVFQPPSALTATYSYPSYNPGVPVAQPLVPVLSYESAQSYQKIQNNIVERIPESQTNSGSMIAESAAIQQPPPPTARYTYSNAVPALQVGPRYYPYTGQMRIPSSSPTLHQNSVPTYISVPYQIGPTGTHPLIVNTPPVVPSPVSVQTGVPLASYSTSATSSISSVITANGSPKSDGYRNGRITLRGGRYFSKKNRSCTICKKVFNRPSGLRIHMHTHTGEKPFQCEWANCGKRFSVRSNMIRHLKIHKREGKRKVKETHNNLHMQDESEAARKQQKSTEKSERGKKVL
ncbi:hypothetical protein FOA43_003832 [Brettanomyces nanus]|uniref:C2H2-type domain-containing protein n=1 Tax=Eeniella nana TaxID=13502 RepID=A0A875S696_EENNA|nr:uncharacterized protein FOA43_003832 [Brettanomyces nanus]QPG76443.1 hypothetical protein FOA43_003832 [Brettanomyces nanus]